MIRYALFCTLLEAVEGRLCSLEVPLVLVVPEMMRCVLLRMLEAVEGLHCLLEVLDVLEVMRSMLLCLLEVPEVMRCVQVLSML